MDNKDSSNNNFDVNNFDMDLNDLLSDNEDWMNASALNNDPKKKSKYNKNFETDINERQRKRERLKLAQEKQKKFLQMSAFGSAKPTSAYFSQTPKKRVFVICCLIIIIF